MALNVNRNVEYAFYQYKMPRLFTKIEGKGNGIKTVVVNMVDIGRALARPPTYITTLAANWGPRPSLTSRQSDTLSTAATTLARCRTSSTGSSRSLFSARNVRTQKLFSVWRET